MTAEQLLAGTVVAVDKPLQWTSFQAVNKVKATVRRLFDLKKFKIGHAGTLDPMATGLLLVCIGRATKSIPQLQDGEKEYTGTIVLGATTPCYDLEQDIDRYYPYDHITEDKLDVARRQLTGCIMQTPPLYSALKIDGRRAYEYVRDERSKGADGAACESVAAKVEARQVVVAEFEITAFRKGAVCGADGKSPYPQVAECTSATAPAEVAEVPQPRPTGADVSTQLYRAPQGTVPAWLPQVDFRIRCSKGTYIRSIARDFGQALGSGAYLSALRRTRIGDYSVNNAVRPDDAEQLQQLFSA